MMSVILVLFLISVLHSRYVSNQLPFFCLFYNVYYDVNHLSSVSDLRPSFSLCVQSISIFFVCFRMCTMMSTILVQFLISEDGTLLCSFIFNAVLSIAL